MKSRILEELNQLASDAAHSPFRSLFEDLSDDELEQRAYRVLVAMLSDYSAIRIKTIDAFFQEILRTFARELNLDSNYRVLLDEQQMVADAAARLIARPFAVQSTATKEEREAQVELASWLKDLANEQLVSGRGHSLTQTVRALGRELFKEQVLALGATGNLPSRENLRELKKALDSSIERFRAEALGICAKAAEIVDRTGTSVKDFANGANGPIGRLLAYDQKQAFEAPKTTFIKVLYSVSDSGGDLTAMLSGAAKGKKGTAPNPMALEAAGELYGLMEAYAALFADEKRVLDFYTSELASAYIGRYGIIGELHRLIAELEMEGRSMLNSGSSSLISKLLDGDTTAPILYERIGTRIDHHMIDEFQDTSRKQYDNFLPLLVDSLSSHKKSLVVGDVKQSIYRFRNADRRILAYGIESDLKGYSPKHHDLVQNWRSSRQVVTFNNALFSPQSPDEPPRLPRLAYEHLCGSNNIDPRLIDFIETLYPDQQGVVAGFMNEILDSYKAPPQEISPVGLKEKGAVVVHRYGENYAGVLDASREDSPRSESQDGAVAEIDGRGIPSSTLQTLPSVLIDLQKRGYKPSDIAILVREKRHAAAIATHLLRIESELTEASYSLKVVSSEALLISSSIAVNFIVEALRFASTPTDSFSEGVLEEAFVQMVLLERHSEEEARSCFRQDIRPSIHLAARNGLYELCEEVAALIQPYIEAGEKPYLLGFFDLVLEYMRYGEADTHGFLSYWESSGRRQCISIPEADDAITLITIHKAKGLGFPVVLLPSPFDWSMRAGRDMLWCDTDVWARNTDDEAIREALRGVSHLPIPYKKDAANTFFVADYYRETCDKIIDNLNTIYVSTTRAKNELHLWLPQVGLDSPSRAEKEEAIMLEAMVELAEQSDLELVNWVHPEEEIEDTAPDGLPRYERKEKKADHIIQFDEPLSFSATYRSRSRLRILTHAADELKENAKLVYGRAMHRVLESIVTAADIPEAVRLAESQGLLPAEQVEPLRESLVRMIAQPEVAAWFDGSGRVLVEATILSGGLGERRPDRIILYEEEKRAVVVDYKFGERRRRRDSKQVREYMQLLEAMGYLHVEGYVWHPDDDEIIKV